MTKKAAKWWLIGMGIVLPVLYVLSPGPVIGMHRRSASAGVLEEFLQVFYFPLEYLYNHVEWVENFYDWWFSVWDA